MKDCQKQCNREEWIDSKYLYFKKACDRVANERSIWKLEHKGVQGNNIIMDERLLGKGR